jgi:UDP-N-acetylmuramoyl-tripeptide--D-alanyl-D-alanine ligase
VRRHVGRQTLMLGRTRGTEFQHVAEHEGLAADVAAHADLLFACGSEMRRLFDAVPLAIQGVHAETSADLAPDVVSALRPGDVILVKGSLGSRMAKIIAALPVSVETEEPA